MICDGEADGGGALSAGGNPDVQTSRLAMQSEARGDLRVRGAGGGVGEAPSLDGVRGGGGGRGGRGVTARDTDRETGTQEEKEWRESGVQAHDARGG